MNKEEIEAQIKSWMKEDIQEVLSGKKESVSLLYVRPGDVDKYINEIGGTSLEDFDSNGWSWDYWMTYKVDGKEYRLSGDGYYNKTATFSLKK